MAIQLSPLQKFILIEVLKSKDGLKFSEIKPDDTETDLFNYHLQHLVKKGLLEKKDGRYSLTFAGEKFVEEENPINALGVEHSRYKVNAVLLIIRENAGKKEILVQRRKRHPFYGNVHIPGGNIKKGEKIIVAAKRKCQEETGLVADFQDFGIIRKISLNTDGTVFRDLFLNVCVTDQYSGELQSSNDFGDNFWTDLDSASDYERNCTSPSKKLVDIYQFLKDHHYSEIPFFLVEEENKLMLNS